MIDVVAWLQVTDIIHCYRLNSIEHLKYVLTFSGKCSSVPCLNGGRCVGINRCRCRRGYSGNQCEAVSENIALSNSGMLSQ